MKIKRILLTVAAFALVLVAAVLPCFAAVTCPNENCIQYGSEIGYNEDIGDYVCNECGTVGQGDNDTPAPTMGHLWNGLEWETWNAAPSNVYSGVCPHCFGGINYFHTRDTFYESDPMLNNLIIESDNALSGKHGSGASGFVVSQTEYEAEHYFLRWSCSYLSRALIRAYDSNGTRLTSADVTIVGGTYNSYYGAWYLDAAAGSRSWELLFPQKVAYFKVGFCWTSNAAARYSITDITLTKAENAPFRPYGESGTVLFWSTSAAAETVACPLCTRPAVLASFNGFPMVCTPQQHDIITSLTEQNYVAGVESGDTQGYDRGYAYGYSDGLMDGNEAGYEGGYEDGESTGYENGYNQGNESGYTAGHAAGYNTGYAEGEQSTVSENFIDMIGEIAAAPYNAVVSMFDFEIFGVNIASFIFKAGTLIIIAVVGGLVVRLLF